MDLKSFSSPNLPILEADVGLDLCIPNVFIIPFLLSVCSYTQACGRQHEALQPWKISVIMLASTSSSCFLTSQKQTQPLRSLLTSAADLLRQPQHSDRLNEHWNSLFQSNCMWKDHLFGEAHESTFVLLFQILDSHFSHQPYLIVKLYKRWQNDSRGMLFHLKEYRKSTTDWCKNKLTACV